MASSRDKLLAQFRELVTERLGRVSKALMTLEAGEDIEAGKTALRELHGLKGEARMMGFPEVNSLAHEMEELLRAAQPMNYGLGGGSVDVLLVVVDALAVLAGSTQGEAPNVGQMLDWLKTATASEKVRAAQAAAASPLSAPQPHHSQPAGAPPPPPEPSASVPQPQEADAAVAPAPNPPSAPASAPRPSAPQVAEQRIDSSVRISQQSLEVLTSAVTSLQQRARRRELASAQGRELIRELGMLHRHAEEMGLAAAPLVARIGKVKDLASENQRISSMVAADEVRELSVLAAEIMALRMVPISLLLEPYPRMVRELAKALGKEVELRIDGGDERVDRSVLDALKDPLLHLVRNAVDHGLERRPAREAAGKPPKGVITVRAAREGERLVLRVADDGRGLDPEELRRVAVRKGLLPETAAANLDDASVIDLIFVAGFSSKEGATDISGRGVGLDVVRTNCRGIGGDVTVTSTPGRGAVFELRAPVSLTVAPVLFVRVGDDRLCLPAANVVRAIEVAKEHIVEAGGRTSLRLGDTDEVLPYLSIATILGTAPERTPKVGELILVIQGRGQLAAVAVDQVLEERIQTILPLRGMLSRFLHLSGATALTDGTLALVLAPPHLVSTVHGRETRLSARPARTEIKKRRVLVVDDSPLTRELLVQLLESAGYGIVQAADGAQALSLLSEQSVDIVVTDLEMPNVDGLELTRRLKSHPILGALPVVIVTTRGSDNDRRRGMEAGADGYVTKSDLVRQDLVDVVARLLV